MSKKREREPSRRDETRSSIADAKRAVRADELLTIAAVGARLGLGAASLRTMRRQGLRVVRLGGRAFVTGRDLLDFASRIGNADGGEG